MERTIHKPKPKKPSTKRLAWGFLLPALICFVLVIIIPFFIGLYYSFTDWDAIDYSPSWIGLRNYITVFQDNPRFIYSILITVVFALFNVIVINIISFSLAMLVTRGLKFQNIYRVGFFLPNLIGGLILGYIWRFIFDSVFVNVAEGLNSFINSEIFNTTSWLFNRNTALIAISFAWLWQYAGYIMMIYIAAIQNIPKDLIEASSIDGASQWQKLRHITLPLVAPAFTVTLFLTLINSFKQFDVNYSLTGGSPSTEFMGIPIWGTKLIAFEIYDTYQTMKEPALAQSMAIIFFIILTVISIAQVRYSKSKEVEI